MGRGGQKFSHKNIKNKRKRKDDSDDEEEEFQKKRIKSPTVVSTKLDQIKLPGFSKSSETKLKNFKRCFWAGPVPSEDDIESLKLQRKNLGVLVKGFEVLKCPAPISSITSPGIPAEFKNVFDYSGLSSPTIVQMQAWPAILNGNNALVIAPTGSGKTMAYGLPIIPHVKHRLESCTCKLYDIPAPIALILVPTRELAIQVSSALRPLNKLFSLSSIPIYGGDDKDKQIELLSEGTGKAIVVATPGRLLDLLFSRAISLANVTYLVLDEADRMLALGFLEQINMISEQIYPGRHSMMFSATFPGKLREVADAWIPNSLAIRCNTLDISVPQPITDPVSDPKQEHVGENEVATAQHIDDKDGNFSNDQVARPQSSYSISPTIEQMVHLCSSHKKPRLLIRYILKVREEEKVAKVRQPGLMLIFCTKIKTLKFVADFLRRQDQNGFVILHGQLPQVQREKALNDFKCGKVPIMIATDVAARGIHIKSLKYVVNYDFPSNLEQYCHRVGRTGRQGEKGYSYSLITRNLAPLAKDLILLIQSCGQVPEPNLVTLSEEYNSGTMPESECIIEDDSLEV